MSLALGGQTLLTADARAALGETAWRVQSHGHWRIKGLAEPMELFEVGDERGAVRRHRRTRPRSIAWCGRRAACGCRCARCRISCRPSATTLSAGRMRWPSWRAASMPARGWCRCWASAAPARRGWRCASHAAGWVTFRVVCGSATCRRRAMPTASCKPWPRLWTCRWATTIRCGSSGMPSAARGTCLVILDNFEQVSRHAEDTLGRWLDRAAQARFLVTYARGARAAGRGGAALPPLDASRCRRRCSCAARRRRGSDFVAARRRTRRCGRAGRPTRRLAAGHRAGRGAGARDVAAGAAGAHGPALPGAGGRAAGAATARRRLRAAFDWSWDLLDDAEKDGAGAAVRVRGQVSASRPSSRCWICRTAAATPGCRRCCSRWSTSLSCSAPEAGRFGLLRSVQDYAAASTAHAAAASRAAAPPAEARRSRTPRQPTSRCVARAAPWQSMRAISTTWSSPAGAPCWRAMSTPAVATLRAPGRCCSAAGRSQLGAELAAAWRRLPGGSTRRHAPAWPTSLAAPRCLRARRRGAAAAAAGAAGARAAGDVAARSHSVLNSLGDMCTNQARLDGGPRLPRVGARASRAGSATGARNVRR